MKRLPGRIAANSAGPKKLALDGRPSTCNVTTSAALSNSWS